MLWIVPSLIRFVDAPLNPSIGTKNGKLEKIAVKTVVP
jgi:hypothetical protein